MKIIFSRGDTHLIEQVRSGDDAAMEKVYSKYRNEFVSWSMKKYSISENRALDYYQDAITILFEKAINNTLGSIQSSLKTYLFGIGKNLVRQDLDSLTMTERHGSNLAEHYFFLAHNDEVNEIYQKAKEVTKQVFHTIGEPCKSILTKFYFEKKSMTEIAMDLNYKSEAVARTSKKRCLEKIRENLLKPTQS